MPSQSRKEWTRDTDPHTWPVFERVTLQKGMVKPDKFVLFQAPVRRSSNSFFRVPQYYPQQKVRG